MRRAWRLVRKNNTKDAFTGEGARIAGGRWNHKEIALVYTSESLSLATLELLVHLKRYEIKFSVVYFPLEVPDSVPIEEISQVDLPSNWRTEPPPNATKQVGTEWVKRGSSAVLRVPSIIIPIEFNLLFNPAHHDFRKIRIGDPEPFVLDPRIIK